MNSRSLGSRYYRQHLAISSDTSTCTEIEDIVDVDYFSDYSFDLSNDEDEEENFEDLESETFLNGVLLAIEGIAPDPTEGGDPQRNTATYALPRHLLVECHVWKQKFRQKRISLERTKKNKLDLAKKGRTSIVCHKMIPIEEKWSSSGFEQQTGPSNVFGTDKILLEPSMESVERVLLPPLVSKGQANKRATSSGMAPASSERSRSQSKTTQATRMVNSQSLPASSLTPLSLTKSNQLVGLTSGDSTMTTLRSAELGRQPVATDQVASGKSNSPRASLIVPIHSHGLSSNPSVKLPNISN